MTFTLVMRPSRAIWPSVPVPLCGRETQDSPYWSGYRSRGDTQFTFGINKAFLQRRLLHSVTRRSAEDADRRPVAD